MIADIALVKCHKHVDDANNGCDPGVTATFDHSFIAGNKAGFTLQLTPAESFNTVCILCHMS